MKMSELKPCPFCGGEANIDFLGGFNVYRVRCTKCPCDMGRYWYSRKDDAKKAWNRRKEGEQK